MNSFFEKHHLSQQQIVIIALFILSSLILISNIGKAILPPITNLQIENAAIVEASDKGMVIADSQYKRLLFLNSQERLVNVLELHNRNIPIDETRLIRIIGDRVFIVGYRLVLDGLYYSSEIIEEYDLTGKFIKEHYRCDYNDNDFVSFPRITDLSINNDDSLVLCKIVNNNFVKINVKDGNVLNEQTVTAPKCIRQTLTVDETVGRYLLTDIAGQHYYLQLSNKIIQPISAEKYIALFLEHLNLSVSNPQLRVNRNYLPKPNMNCSYTAQDGSKNLVHINSDCQLEKYSYLTQKNHLISTIPLSPKILLRVFSFWAAVLYMAFLLLWGLYKIWQKYMQGVLMVTSFLKVCSALVIVAAVITGFYTKFTYDSITLLYNRISQAQSQQLYSIINYDYSDVLNGIRMQGRNWYTLPENQQRLIKLQDFLHVFSTALGKNSSHYISIIFADNNTNEFYELTDSSDHYTTNDEIKNVRPTFNEVKEQEINHKTSQNGRQAYCWKYFTDKNGEVYAILETGYYTDNLSALQLKFAGMAFFTLLAVLIGLYLFYLCIKIFKQRFKEYFHEKAAGNESAKGSLAGVCNLLYGCANYVDITLCVFVVNEILQNPTASELAMYCTLPCVCYSIGKLISSLFLAKLLFRLFPEKTLACGTLIINITAFILMVLSVQVHNIYMFVIAKMIIGTFFSGIIGSLISIFLVSVKDKDKRFDLMYESSRFGIIAIVITTLAGSHLASIFDYSYIYLLPVFSCIILLVIFLMVCSNKPALVAADDADSDFEKITHSGSFFLSSLGIQYVLFIVIPFFTLSYYGEYLFPLCGAAVGISPIIIANCSIFAYVINTVCTDYVNKFKKTFSSRTNVLMVITYCSLLLTGFALSQTMTWAILTLFLSMVVFTPADAFSYQTELCLEYGFSAKKASIEYSLINSVLGICRGGVFSLLASVQIFDKCLLVGVFCLVMASIFFIYSNKLKKTSVA